MRNSGRKIPVVGIIAAVLITGPASMAVARDTDDLKKEVQELREQNQLLQHQLEEQRQMIEQLSHRFSELEKTNEQHQSDLRTLQSEMEANTPPPPADNNNNKTFSLGNAVLSGEGAAGFFDTGKNGRYPHAPFRVDEARLFVDAPIWDDIFFYGQVDLITPQAIDNGLYLGELYLQFENVGKQWNWDQLLNLKVGQFYIPFGEEYQYRFAIDDPLISHSLSDLWGYDAGLELYGSWRKLSYVAAVQDGGISTLNSGSADKSVAGRVSYDPLSWLHFSASGMRTGNISVSGDGLTGLWFGSGLFKSIGSHATTLFDVDLAEFDASAKWKGGYVKAAGGYARYSDNDPVTGGNHRDIYYDYIEALQHVTPKFYGVTRFSQIRAPGGYPIVGNTGTFGLPTTDLWRLSLGLGYQLNSHLTLKAEYMLEHGQFATGGPRNHENMVAAEAAFKF